MRPLIKFWFAQCGQRGLILKINRICSVAMVIMILLSILRNKDEQYLKALRMCSIAVALMTFDRQIPTKKGVTHQQPKHRAPKWPRSWTILREDRPTVVSTHRAQANVNVLNRIDRSPPPYVTLPSSNTAQSDIIVHPNAPSVSPMRNLEAESERTSYVPDPSGRTYGRIVYSWVPANDRFAFTPVDANPSSEPLPNPSNTLNDSS